MDAALTLIKGAPRRMLPNINAQRRTLPASVDVDLADPAKAVMLDAEVPVRRLLDPQLYELRLTVSIAERAAHPMLQATVNGLGTLITLIDQSGRPQPSGVIDIAAAFAASTKLPADQLVFFLEARTFESSPLLRGRAVARLQVSFKDGNTKVQDVTLKGSAASLVLTSDLDAPTRLYIADTDDNQPTVLDVTSAMAGSGVPLVKVPAVVCNGDTWLQDQFQVAMAFDDQLAQMGVMVHLPRMRSNSRPSDATSNLAIFADMHFPSVSIGVMKDFWTSKLSVTASTSAGAPSQLQLMLRDTNPILTAMTRVSVLWSQITSVLQALQASPASPSRAPEFYTRRKSLASNLNVLRTRSIADARLRAMRDAAANALQAKLAVVDQLMPLVGTKVRITINGTAFDLDETQINKLASNVFDLHSSTNYGGNIEVSPRTSSAPFGKVVVGSVASEDLRFLLDQLDRQTFNQPTVEFNTSWLGVGHVDEIVGFVPSNLSSTGPFCIARGSPTLGLSLLDAVKKARDAGVLVTRLFRGRKWAHEEAVADVQSLLPPSAYLFLVGRFGKYDLHDFDKVPTTIPPPPSAYFDDRRFLILIRQNMAPRAYSASMIVDEVLEICRETNRTVDDVFLGSKRQSAKLADYPLMKGFTDKEFSQITDAGLDTVFSQEFDGVPVVPLPMIFDRVDSFLTEQTMALIPGLVNLQQLGRLVMLPKPYGPRMRPAAAVDLLKAFLSDLDSATLPTALRDAALKNLTVDGLHRRGLDVTTHWTKAWVYSIEFDPTALNKSGWSNAPETLTTIADLFRDGFDEFKNPARDYAKDDGPLNAPADKQYRTDIQKVKDRIKNANPGKFDSRDYPASDKWIKIRIPENTVDIFEAYTQLVLEGLGLTVKFVDSWFYHTHAGGIHCATNVMRTMDAATLKTAVAQSLANQPASAGGGRS